MAMKIAVLIMAAGASRRMKGIKQLMPWKDSNFLVETIKTVQKSDATSVNVVLGSNADLIASTCQLTEMNINVFTNTHWDKGLGNSIAYGVQSLLKQYEPYNGILICLADQPLLEHQHLNNLIDQFEKNTSKIIATDYNAKAGVPVLFPTLHFKALSQLDGDFGAKDYLNKHTNNIISLNATRQIIDIDTTREYEQLMAEAKKTHI